MAWKEVTVLSLRKEFVSLATGDDANISELCRRFGISRKTGYKWLRRFDEDGIDGLADRSRRPLSSPAKTLPDIEQIVLDLRDNHPAWGGRKLRRRLLDLGEEYVPRESTITEILRRNARLDEQESLEHMHWQRFEHDEPNDLWQMDFKGPVKTDAGMVHPLTVLDDYSRYSLVLAACQNQQAQTVKERLIQAFEKYGLPWRMLCDNGSPWGNIGDYTKLGVWLIRLGISISHGRPYHPQTQGKEERFHKSLKAEVLRYSRFRDQFHLQDKLSEWQQIYNQQRPHEGLGLDVPARRYRVSARSYSCNLAPIEYGPDDLVRKVQIDGSISIKSNCYKIGKAFHSYPVAIRPTNVDGLFDVFFCHQKVKTLNLNNKNQDMDV